LTALLLVLRWGNLRCVGSMPVSFFTFIAILFTSGLDVGLIMFPLVDFETYATEAEYSFANPLAIEFGFWGFLVWVCYFLTTFYFCIVEPKLKLFEIPAIKITNNIVVIGTCAFTAFLFLSYLPDYIAGISEPFRYGLVAAVILFATLSSTDIKYVKVLSVSSTLLFFALIAGAWLVSGMGFSGLVDGMVKIGAYFSNLPRFVSPINEYHQFYLYWWFAWSIMIGQFVARFVGDMKAWHLAALEHLVRPQSGGAPRAQLRVPPPRSGSGPHRRDPALGAHHTAVPHRAGRAPHRGGLDLRSSQRRLRPAAGVLEALRGRQRVGEEGTHDP
jgi:choline-glycine betaine transporter